MNLAKPKTAAGWVAVGLGAAALLAELVFIPAEASAVGIALNGPPVTSQPGPYYNQGDFIGICVADPGSGAQTYIEVHTNFGTHASPVPGALGNCAGQHTQLVVPADPSLYPVPSPASSG